MGAARARTKPRAVERRPCTNDLIAACARDGDLAQARSLFDAMPRRNVSSWNVMIAAYAGCGRLGDAEALFHSMPSRDLVSWNTMITAYAKNGRICCASSVFESMPRRNLVSWNSIISAHAHAGHGATALILAWEMQIEGVQPDRITFTNALEACARIGDLKSGRLIHAGVSRRGFQSDIVIENALVNMYGKCGSVRSARAVFDTMSQRDVISWNAMIAAYARNGRGKDAIELARLMCSDGIRLEKITFVSLLDACACLENLNLGRAIHAHVTSIGHGPCIVLSTALVNMYGKCRCLEDARNIFDGMSQRDAISWTAMIASYAQNERGEEALNLFRQMVWEGGRPGATTFISVLGACGGLAGLEWGKTIHAHIAQSDCESDVVVATALVDMYGKCGCLKDARSVFERMPQRNIASWNAMVAAYSQNGQGEGALWLFQQMSSEGIKPNAITIRSVLSACSHAGLLDQGCHCFATMHREYGVVPTAEHYVCMIDLLGRFGKLDEAECLIVSVPLESHAMAWMCFLGACRVHGDLERGERASEILFELDPENAATYVLLSNMYAIVGRWDDAKRVRKMMSNRSLSSVLSLHLAP